MKKVVLIVVLFACSAFCIQPFSYFWNIRLTGDTATVAKWKANNDSVLNWSTRVCDTLKLRSIPRWNMFSNHDSTFKWMNVDTLPSVDTAWIKNAKIDKVDSVYSVKGIKGTTGQFSGTVSVDSLSSTKGIRATTGTFSGTGTFDSVFANKFKVPTVFSVDSLYSTRGIKATSGTFSGIVNVDSLHSTKGLIATSLSLTKSLIVDSVECNQVHTIGYILSIIGKLWVPTSLLVDSTNTRALKVTEKIYSTAMPSYNDSAAAYAGGVRVGQFYRIAGTLKIMY